VLIDVERDADGDGEQHEQADAQHERDVQQAADAGEARDELELGCVKVVVLAPAV